MEIKASTIPIRTILTTLRPQRTRVRLKTPMTPAMTMVTMETMEAMEMGAMGEEEMEGGIS